MIRHRSNPNIERGELPRLVCEIMREADRTSKTLKAAGSVVAPGPDAPSGVQ
jgi:hypothetical protein